MLNYLSHLTVHNMSRHCNGLCTYSGGKARLYDYIAALVYMMRAETFIELCAGSAYVSLNLQVTHKIINDAELSLSVIYKALSIPHIADKLLCRLKGTVYSEEVFNAAVEYWRENVNKSLSEFDGEVLYNAAFHSWVLHTFSRIGSTVSQKFIDTKAQQNDFLRFQKKLIKYYHRLDNAQVFNRSLLDILQDLADNPDKISPNTVIYIDPPYLPSKKRGVNSEGTYNKKFTREDHAKMLMLADKLPREKCKVIISGYDDMYNLYDDTLNGNDFGEWSKVFVKRLYVMCGDGSKLKDGKRAVEDEYFFTNFILE